MSYSNVVEDLNLLRVLAVLLEEKSVTGAGRRLGVSQSAVSHKLRQLRERFDDPLLVASRGGLVPTRRALAVGAAVGSAVRDLEAAARLGDSFEPARSTRAFTIAASDYWEAGAAPLLLARFAVEAPLVDLRVVSAGPRLMRQLEDGDIDCATGPAFRYAFETPTLRRTRLVRERFVVAMRAGHPLGQGPLTAARLVEFPHLQIAPTGRPGGAVDDALAALGLERRVAMRTTHFMSAPLSIAGSDLVAVASAPLVEQAKRFAAIETHPLPPELEVAPVDIFLLWHERQHTDPGHRWFRDHVLSIVSDVPGADPPSDLEQVFVG